MDSFGRFPPLTDIFTCGQRPQLQGIVKSLCVRYLERFMSTINGRHVLSADHSINWHLISGWTWRTASLAWYNHWGRNQAQVWAFKPNGAEWKKSSAHCSQQHHYDHHESFIIVWNIQIWTWPWAIEHYQKSVEWKNAQPSIVESTFSLLLAASCLLGPASVHWATNNKYFFSSFSNIRQIFGPTVSVSGTAPSVQDLCLPSAVPTHLFPFDIHPSTSHNRFIVIFTFLAPSGALVVIMV